MERRGALRNSLRNHATLALEPPTLPHHIRNTLYKLIDRRESLTEDVLDPVLDLWCDSIVLGWFLGKGNEQGADLRGDVELPVVKPKSVGHSCGMMKNVAGTWTHSFHAVSYKSRIGRHTSLVEA